ncbi:hypothetical protein NET03_02950 [Thermomicrobium sp. CFH 73360]|uniref:hypothetical protein n=1 Tax=Thermomicrobium sp. CFH 73360 TaxID=2951987 RepID=UPI002076B34E|nr:hypothetical protein [Thermomicrobium sp. CFH 73360]MCM8745481.1 hypothetical protein [Thermomicrobium sp. CFH 73360]
MTFDTRDLRIGMDVYTADWVYLGTVRRVRLGPAPNMRPVRALPNEGSIVSGEFLGPQPTAPLGNPGPLVQTAANGYATGSDDALPLGTGAIAVGRLPLPLGWYWIPVSAIQIVSFERLVLGRTAAELGRRPRRPRPH